MRRIVTIQLALTVVVGAGLLAWAWTWPDPPQADGLAFDDLPTGSPEPREEFDARDGARLAYRAYESADSDTVVIALHGSGTDSRYLAPLAEAVSGAGIAHVATPDLRGHGPEPERRGDVDDPAQLERDLADLIEHLEARWQAQRTIVVGHSSGGGLAARFAGGAYGGRADGYLLLAPYLGHDAPSAREGSGGWAHPNVGRIVVIDLLRGLGIDALAGVEVLRFRMPPAQQDGYETLAYTHRMMTALEPRDWRDDLSASPAPVRILAGEQDESMRTEGYLDEVASTTPVAADLVEGVGHLDIVAHDRVVDELRTLIEQG